MEDQSQNTEEIDAPPKLSNQNYVKLSDDFEDNES